MITTTYKCDRCGHEQAKQEQMWQVAVSVQHLANNPALKREFRWLPNTTPIWCRKCCDEVGLIGQWKPPEDAPEAPAPTLEEQIREVIREEIEAATGGRA